MRGSRLVFTILALGGLVIAVGAAAEKGRCPQARTGIITGCAVVLARR
jgi:hypothetical protein